MAVLNPIRQRRWAGFWLAVLAVLSGSASSLPAQPAISKEYQVKAAFLYNFAQFVEWPGNAFTNADEAFHIGVLGDDPFGAALDETIRGEAINNRKIVVEHARRVENLKDCQMIFICQSEKAHLKEILAGVEPQAVLTVSEMDGFAERGVGINFYLEGSKVRFEINPAATQHEGLKVSSQLLSLGKVVQMAKEEK